MLAISIISSIMDIWVLRTPLNILDSRYQNRSSHWRCSIRKGLLRNFAKFTVKHLCHSLFFNKEALTQVFSYEFWEIFKNTFFTEHLWTTASVNSYNPLIINIIGFSWKGCNSKSSWRAEFILWITFQSAEARHK